MSSQLPALPSSIAPVNSALEPSWVRNGSESTRQAYASALAFEEMLLEQMSSSLSEAGSSEGTEGEAEGQPPAPKLGGGAFSSMLPQALAKGVAAGGGLGLAAELTRELQGTQAPSAGAAISSQGGASAPQGDAGASNGAAVPPAAPAAPTSQVAPVAPPAAAPASGSPNTAVDGGTLA
jgi:Rod binding domain-containing protein